MRASRVRLRGMPSDSKPIPASVRVATEKARAQRIERLSKIIEGRLGEPVPVVDALMAELGEGASHPELWEKLHAAAARDGKDAALADAYKKCADGARMKRLSLPAQAEMLMRAADYFQGMLGDDASAEIFLERVMNITPEHTEAFARLERRLEKRLDSNRLLELYARVAAVPPRPLTVLANQALHRLVRLSPQSPLSEDACKRLVALVPANVRVLDALEAHCRGTKRFALACVLLEQALRGVDAHEPLRIPWRKRLVRLYVGEAASPELAMPHVEELLEGDPMDASVFEIGEKLLSVRNVASRAAAALASARRRRGQ